jgi:phenylacetate-CoA ligase
LQLIRSVEGPLRGVLRTSSGRVVSGLFFPHFFKDFPEIREFQVHQTSLDEIVVYLVLNRALSAENRTLLQFETAKVFGKDIRISFNPVDAIPRTPSGKRSVTVGFVNPSTTDGIDGVTVLGR